MPRLVLGDALERGAHVRIVRSERLFSSERGAERFDDAALPRRARGNVCEIGARVRTLGCERTRLDVLAEKYGCKLERDARMPDLVARGARRLFDERRRCPDGEKLEYEQRKRRNGRVLGASAFEPGFSDGAAHRRVERRSDGESVYGAVIPRNATTAAFYLGQSRSAVDHERTSVLQPAERPEVAAALARGVLYDARTRHGAGAVRRVVVAEDARARAASVRSVRSFARAPCVGWAKQGARFERRQAALVHRRARRGCGPIRTDIFLTCVLAERRAVDDGLGVGPRTDARAAAGR